MRALRHGGDGGDIEEESSEELPSALSWPARAAPVPWLFVCTLDGVSLPGRSTAARTGGVEGSAAAATDAAAVVAVASVATAEEDGRRRMRCGEEGGEAGARWPP